jgi:hypothetical protein
LFFQVDERYAKEKEITPQLAQIQKQLTDLTDEMGKLAGTEQVLVAIVTSRGGHDRPRTQTAARAPAAVGAAPDAPETKAAKAPPVAVPKTDDERKVLLDKVTKGLAETQVRLQNIQQQVSK